MRNELALNKLCSAIVRSKEDSWERLVVVFFQHSSKRDLLMRHNGRIWLDNVMIGSVVFVFVNNSCILITTCWIRSQILQIENAVVKYPFLFLHINITCELSGGNSGMLIASAANLSE